MPPTREDVLADPGFYQKPLDFQEKVLTAVDPAFSGLDPEQRMQALSVLNTQHGVKSGFAPTMSPEEITSVNAMLAGKKPPPTKPSFGLSDVPGAVLTGLMNIPSLIVEPVKAYNKLRNIPKPEAPKTLAELRAQMVAPSELASRAGSALKESALGGANALSLGLANQFLPPPTTEEDEARRMLGGAVASAAPFTGLAKAARLAGLGPAASRLAAGTTMGAVEPLSRGDIGEAISGATTGLGAVGGAELGARTIQGALRPLSQKQQALFTESKALGGAEGIIREVNKQLTEGRVPGTFNELPASVEEAGQTVQQAGLLAARKARAQSEMLHSEAIKLAPKNATVPNSATSKLQALIGETESPILQTATEKKLGRLAADIEQRSGGTPIGFGTRGLAGAPPDFIQKIRATLGLQEEGITFERLTNLREDLNRLPTPDDASARLLKLAVKAVDSDIDLFGKKYPDAVKAYRQWQDFYRREVGTYHGEGAPLRSLTNQAYGEFEVPASEVIPKLLKMAPEEIRNVIQGIRKGPAGANAVDNIQAGAVQHLIEESINPGTGEFNSKKFIQEFGDPARSRQLREALGPRHGDAEQFAAALRKAGLHKYQGNPGSVGFFEAYHALRGVEQGIMGNPFGTFYHLSTAGTMLLSPTLAAKIINNRAGRNLLAAGVLERPGTPRAELITERLQKVAKDLGGTETGPIDITPPPAAKPTLESPISARRSAETMASEFEFARSDRGAELLHKRMQSESGPPETSQTFRRQEIIAPPTVRGTPRTTPTGQPLPGSYRPPTINLETTPIRMPGPEVRQLPTSINDANDIVSLARQRALEGGPLEPELINLLRQFSTNQALPSNLRRISSRLLDVNFARYPDGAEPVIALKKQKAVLPVSGQRSFNVDALPPSGGRRFELPPAPPVAGLSKEPTLQEYARKVPKQTREISLGGFIDREVHGNQRVRGFGKYLVSPAEMREIRQNIGKDASRWFTTEQTGRVQPIEDLIESLQSNNFIQNATWDEMISALVERTKIRR